LAKAKKATSKVPKKEAVPAKKVLAATAPVPPEPPKPSKKDLAQEALDKLGTATPSVARGGELVYWVREDAYKAVEACLVSIIED